jgi:hypothetical protein|tara:strand:+ start:245 stop:748 length:504 start_codon:yes stop_codon:yes gene_type:complete
MAEYPHISKGLGKLTPSIWSRLMKMLRSYESSYPRDERQTKRGTTTDTVPILAIITGNSLTTSNEYEYSWSEVQLGDGSNTYSVVGGGLSGTEALNTCEATNSADHVGPGVHVGSAYYPSGFDMMPIGEAGDGTAVDVVVVMHAVSDAGGNTRYVFSMSNAHDGSSC